jgi:hypothetical protein
MGPQSCARTRAWTALGKDARACLPQVAVYSFTAAPFSDNVGSGGSDTSHFTQLVWRSSTELGCSVALGRSGRYSPCSYVVCRFSPPGNQANDAAFLANVLPRIRA